MLGFRPALSYARLFQQLGTNFEGLYVPDGAQNQLKGLVVQGIRGRNGGSIIISGRENRGVTDIEDLAPALRTRMENNLREGALSQADPLVRNLFIRYWYVESGGDLIGNMRWRAEWIADRQPDFYGLRLEIHNFPNANTLDHLKSFAASFIRLTSDLGIQCRQLIAEMEQFLGLSQLGNRFYGRSHTASGRVYI